MTPYSKDLITVCKDSEKRLREDEPLRQVSKNKNQNNKGRKGIAMQLLDNRLVTVKWMLVKDRRSTEWPFLEPNQETSEADETAPAPHVTAVFKCWHIWILYNRWARVKKCLAWNRKPTLHAAREASPGTKRDQQKEKLMDRSRKKQSL